jgi:hypothetical protein
MDTMARSDDLDERLDAAVLELVAADKLNAKIFEHGPGDPGPSWEKREEAIAKVARAWNMRQRHEQRERKIMLYELGRHEFADAVRLIEDQQWTILKLRRAKERALALQLLYLKASESMGNHDSKVVDADSVD